MSWRYEDVAWGLALCGRKGCMRDAQLLLDGELFCLDCADELVERETAVMLAPSLRSTLPGLDDR